jgi:hypothetical protein
MTNKQIVAMTRNELFALKVQCYARSRIWDKHDRIAKDQWWISDAEMASLLTELQRRSLTPSQEN